MNIELTPDQRDFVQKAIDSGRFSRVEDVIQEALALWEERERRRLEILMTRDAADGSLARGEGREITEASMKALGEDVKQRGRRRSQAECSIAIDVGYNAQMDWREHITVDPAVLHGKACIRGTRIPVAVVLANLADGLSAAEIIRSYPSLTAEDIQAALAYAAELAQERVLPFPA